MCQFSLSLFAISNVVANEANVQDGGGQIWTFRIVQGFKFDIFRELFLRAGIVHKWGAKLINKDIISI